MNRFNFGSQAKQAISIVGGMIKAGSELKKTADNTEKTAEITDDIRNKAEQERQDRLGNIYHEERMAKINAKPQQSLDEYKANSSAPELEALGGALDLVNRQAAAAEPATITDNTEVE